MERRDENSESKGAEENRNGHAQIRRPRETRTSTYLEIDDGRAESFRAQLHDRVGAEGVAHLEVRHGCQPDARVDLDLDRGDEY